MRITVLFFILSFVGSSIAKAQYDDDGGITASIKISATVVQSIELITVNSISLGKMQPGQKEVIIHPIRDLNAGYMIAVGSPGAEFRLTYLSERELVQTEGKGTLRFTYNISGGVSENQSNSELLENDNRNIQFNNEGRYYIWVGGTINLENASPGIYEGDFTIEIDYI